MILVGQYDSPYTRRVAVSLGLLGFRFEHDTRSVFGDFDSMRTTNPLGRIPSLILPDGTTLIDSAAILDWLDQRSARNARLLPSDGLARQQALQRIALATGTIDKVMAGAYERLIRPAIYRWPDWIARCRTQAEGGLAALASTILAGRCAALPGLDHHSLHDPLRAAWPIRTCCRPAAIPRSTRSRRAARRCLCSRQRIPPTT